MLRLVQADLALSSATPSSGTKSYYAIKIVEFWDDNNIICHAQNAPDRAIVIKHFDPSLSMHDENIRVPPLPRPTGLKPFSARAVPL